MIRLLRIISYSLLLSAVCLPGFGTGTDTTSGSAYCSGCLGGTYQAGGSTACTACGSIQPYVYPGKDELITSNSTTKLGTATVAGARSLDE